MRIRLPLGRSLFFVVALLFALVALAPLRLVIGWLGLDDRGLAAREARGSIWLGRLSEARLGRVQLGDLDTRLRTFPLLLGRARLDVSGEAIQGGLAISGARAGVEDMTGRIETGGLLAPLPMAALELDDLTVRFADGLCESAEGLVRATVSGDIGGLALPRGLSGNARCDEGALLLPLAGQSGMERLNLRLHDDGRYRLQLVVRPTDDAMRDRLVAAGFTLGGEGYSLVFDGGF